MITFDKIKEVLRNDNFKWSRHALEKINIYGFDEQKIKEEIVEKGELIEYHYWNGYGDKFLVFVESENYGIYHVTIINNELLDIILIKTVYTPDNTFREDKKTRADSKRVL